MDPFLGEIKLFAGNFAPTGWAFCDGQLLSIAQNSALFSLLGTTYGGNGQTTFALPDLRGRIPVGFGQGLGLTNRNLGDMSGVESVTLQVSNLPQHAHPFAVSASSGLPTTVSPQGAVVAAGAGPREARYAPAPGDATLAAQTTGTTGTGTPVSVQNPSLGLNFIIALTGIFPSRP
jgi:microcystin-dependent protein